VPDRVQQSGESGGEAGELEEFAGRTLSARKGTEDPKTDQKAAEDTDILCDGYD
jgi:hypothetical protein